MVGGRTLVVLILTVACTAAPIVAPTRRAVQCGNLREPSQRDAVERIPRRVVARRWIAKTDSDEVLWTDPRTLRPLGRRRVPIPKQTWIQSLHADGRTVALAAGRVWLVDAETMRVTGSRLVRGGVSGLAWIGSHLAVLTQAAVLWLDRSGRQVSSTGLDGRAVRWAATANGFVVLTEARAGASMPPSLTWSAPDGDPRTVVLDQVTAGHDPDEGAFGTLIAPGMAVDDIGDRAVVVQSDGPIAEVDLATMAVTYHDLRTAAFLPSAEAKLSDWSNLEAQWLGDDLVAVWGNKSITLTDGQGSDDFSMREVALGLSLLDLRSWSMCEVDPTVVDVAITNGRMLARATGTEGRNDDTLVAYDSAGRALWRRFGERRTFDIDAQGPFVYAVMSWEGWLVRIIDAETGKFLDVRHHRPPTLLVPGSSISSG